jgi:ADP-heptose:LPS heptosyltransferase
MKINTLRTLDLWIGRPICWAVTVLYKIKKLFVHKGTIQAPRKILFIKLFGMGSIILAIPSIEAVKRRYPEASIYFLTFEENRALFAITDIVPMDNLFTVKKDTLPHLSAGITLVLFRLIRKKIDVVIDLEFFSRFTAILSFAIRSKYRIGFYGFHAEGLKRGSFIDFQVNYNHMLHTSRTFFTLLRPLGIGSDEFEPALPVILPADDLIRKKQALLAEANGRSISSEIDQWVVINPNSGDLIELRKWPAGHFVKLTLMLLDRFRSLGVIYIGSAADRPFVSSLCAEFEGEEASKRIFNLAGKTDLSELIDIFHFAHVLITNDSGPAHLAALTPISIIVLFGPETPALYSPLSKKADCLYMGLDCQPCVTIYNGKRSFCRNSACLHLISPEYVFEIAVKLISNAEASSKTDSGDILSAPHKNGRAD